MIYFKPLYLVATLTLITNLTYANTPSSQDAWRLNHDNKSYLQYFSEIFEHKWDDDPNEIDCTHAAVTQQDMNRCMQRKAQHTVDRLNQLMIELRKILGKADEQWLQLKQLNQDWEQSIEQNCLWEQNYFGFGSVAAMVYHNCIAFYNIQRIDKLKVFLCEGYRIPFYCKTFNND